MKKYLSFMQIVNKGMDLVAATVLVLIMLLTSLDVVLRYLGYPIQGSYDLVTFGAAFVIGFALPRTSWDHMHITVDILVDKIPKKRSILDVITRFMAISLFVLKDKKDNLPTVANRRMRRPPGGLLATSDMGALCQLRAESFPESRPRSHCNLNH